MSERLPLTPAIEKELRRLASGTQSGYALLLAEIDRLRAQLAATEAQLADAKSLHSDMYDQFLAAQAELKSKEAQLAYILKEWVHPEQREEAEKLMRDIR